MEKHANARWQDLVNLLHGSKVYIQTHNYPDPDAVASAFGLQYFLQQFDINASLCYVGTIERSSLLYAMDAFDVHIAPYAAAQGMQAEDKIVLVDGQKANANMLDLPGDEVACIDHHPSSGSVVYQYRDIRPTGACASIIASYYMDAGILIPPNVASMLLYGLCVDTDEMRRGVTDTDLDVFGELYRLADRGVMHRIDNMRLKAADLTAFAEAMHKVHFVGRTAFVSLDMACADALIGQIADFVLALAEADVVIIASRRTDGIRLSARTFLDNVHCGCMLEELLHGIGNGGGHAHMAGGFIPKEHIPADADAYTAMLHSIHQRSEQFMRRA